MGILFWVQLFSFLVKIYKVDICLQFDEYQLSNVSKDIRFYAHSVLCLQKSWTLCTADCKQNSEHMKDNNKTSVK